MRQALSMAVSVFMNLDTTGQLAPQISCEPRDACPSRSSGTKADEIIENVASYLGQTACPTKGAHAPDLDHSLPRRGHDSTWTLPADCQEAQQASGERHTERITRSGLACTSHPQLTGILIASLLRLSQPYSIVLYCYSFLSK